MFIRSTLFIVFASLLILILGVVDIDQYSGNYVDKKTALGKAVF